MQILDRNYVSIAKTIVAVGLLLLIGAVVLLWSWNTVGAELFGGPMAQLRHALAFELAAFVMAVTLTRTRHGVRQS